MEQKSVYLERCFLDFFPKTNKKYKHYYEDLTSMLEYDWNSYQNLIDAGPNRLQKDYCKRSCYNQRFSPNKYNQQSEIYPSIEELVEFINAMDADPTASKEKCIWTIQNRKKLSTFEVSDIRKKY